MRVDKIKELENLENRIYEVLDNASDLMNKLCGYEINLESFKSTSEKLCSRIKSVESNLLSQINDLDETLTDQYYENTLYIEKQKNSIVGEAITHLKEYSNSCL
ncbi:hypothetical protein A3Q56_04125 [Intoshia linei]|uniref:Mediator of RNA polymerase II transcription subunit 11 n=1 Tax=Intoshia linei TaxID=1819745 RepID=A0A177B3D7_9BILA|nr:hypothetical protein A3Q56_04125 [Intoshia linei]